jgi:hypothetical protein
MGAHYVLRDPRVLCELELIPGSQIQEPRQKLRGKYVVNSSRIPELVWHFHKTKRLKGLRWAVIIYEKMLWPQSQISTRTWGYGKFTFAATSELNLIRLHEQSSRARACAHECISDPGVNNHTRVREGRDR